jgi:hypothetical protein
MKYRLAQRDLKVTDKAEVTRSNSYSLLSMTMQLVAVLNEMSKSLYHWIEVSDDDGESWRNLQSGSLVKEIPTPPVEKAGEE